MPPDKPKGPGLFGDDDLDAELDKWTEEFEKFRVEDKKPAVPAARPVASTRPASGPPVLDVGEFLDDADLEEADPDTGPTSSIKPLGEMLGQRDDLEEPGEGVDDNLLGGGHTAVWKSVTPEGKAIPAQGPARGRPKPAPAPSPPAGTQGPPVRRGPAIIRREELQARREGRTPVPVPQPPAKVEPPTRVTDMQKFYPARTMQGVPPPPGGGGVGGAIEPESTGKVPEIDESFYDDIQVGADEAGATPLAPSNSPRMITRNVVRRRSQSDAPPPEARVARPITPAPAGEEPFESDPFPHGDRKTPIGRLGDIGILREESLAAEPLDPGDLEEPLDERPLADSAVPALVFDSSDVAVQFEVPLEVEEEGADDHSFEVLDEAPTLARDEPSKPHQARSAVEKIPESRRPTLPPPPPRPGQRADLEAPSGAMEPRRAPARRTAPQFAQQASIEPPYGQEVEEVEVEAPPLLERSRPVAEPSRPIAAPGDVSGLEIDPARFRFPEEMSEIGIVDDARALLELYRKEIAVTRDRARTALLHVEAGRAAERAGDLEAARGHYEEAHQADPRHAPAARAMRRLLLRLGEFQEALGYLDVEVALASPAEKPALAAYRADLLVALGEQDLARVAFGEILDAKPDDVRSLLAQLELDFADERWGELADMLARVGETVGDSELAHAVWLLRGRLLERGGNAEGAREAYERARETVPSRLPFLGLARLAVREGDYAAIASHEGRLVEGLDDPTFLAAVWRRRAWDLEHAGKRADACRVLEEAHRARPEDPLVLESLAGVLERAGRPAEALRAYETWAKVEPSRPRRSEVLRRAAALYGGTGDPAQAAWALRRAAEEDPSDSSATAELEAAYLAAGDVDAAVALHRARAEADRGDGLYDRMHAARLLERAGRLDDAIAELDRARAEGAEGHPFVDHLARLLGAAGRDSELARVLAESADSGLERRDPAAARLRAARAADRAVRRLLDGGIAPHAGISVDEALSARTAAITDADQAWRRVLEGDPDAALAHVALVRLATRVEEPARLLGALAEAQAAVRDIGRASDYALRRAAVLVEVKEGNLLASGADEALGELLEREPADPRAYAMAVAFAAHAGRWSDVARVLLARAERLSAGAEKDAIAYRAAATLLEREKDFSRSVDVLRPLVEARPSFLGAQMLLESAYRRLGDASSLAVLTQHDSNDDGTNAALRFANLVRLAETLEGQVGDASKAVAVYRRALELRPADPLARDGFAHAAAAAGELTPLSDMALSELTRAEETGELAAKLAAYAELARIDGELRGDQALASISWGSVIEIDPTHPQGLRALERYYAVEQRHGELGQVWQKVLASMTEPTDMIGAAVHRGHLADLAGDREAELMAYRSAVMLAGEALTVVPALRMALFRLETRAREGDDLEELARLDDAAAVYFRSDPRGHASFLTRAGEALLDLGRIDDAMARFKAAAYALPGHAPALRGWQRTALLHEKWADVCDACEKEAESAASDQERARLYFLAAMAAMDHDLDGPRASENLRRVLALDPKHDEAFERVRLLLDEQGKYEELAQLLARRVETETDPRKHVEHHHALAKLFRDFLGDRDRAKAHLRAVLQRDPNDKKAVAALSDIAWEQGQWAEAAESLIVRAKLETDEGTLKEIFYRLGLIYAERLPDPRWAMKSFERVLKIDPNDEGALEQVSRLASQMGEWRLAQGATDRLAQVTADPAQKVVILHRLARIYEDGFKEPHKAEDAYRRALDADPTAPTALAAMIEFYGKKNDGRALRVSLDRLAGLMRMRLGRDLFDGVAYRVLSRALRARAAAGAIGSIEAARCAAEMSHALGAAEEIDTQLGTDAVRSAPKVKGLAGEAIDEQLFHSSIQHGFRQIFRLMEETLAKRFPVDFRRWGLSKGDRLTRGAHPIRDLAHQVAEALGVKEFDVYIAPANPLALAVELTEPLSVVIGSHLAQADKAPQVRFALGRALKLGLSHMAVPAKLSAEELGILLGGLIRQFDPGFTPPAVSPAHVADEQQRLARLIPKRLRDELHPFAAEITGAQFDHVTLWRGVQHTGNRAGLLCSGSLLAGLAVLLRLGNHRDIQYARGDKFVEELLRFAVSEEHCELRKALAS